MKKFFVSVLLLVTAVGTTSAQLLYKISGNGLEKPSYIMGTFHLMEKDLLKSVKSLKTVMQEVDQFCGELDINEVQKCATLLQQKSPNALPNGVTLKDLFTEKQFAQINNCAKKVLGTNFDENPELLQIFGKYEPMVFGGVLNTAILNRFIKDPNNFTPLDVILLMSGQELGKKIIGLETAEFQVGILTHSAPLKQQKKMLMNVVERWDGTCKAIDTWAEAYKRQDMKSMQALINNNDLKTLLFGSKDVHKQLLTKRDADWAKRIPGIMKQQSTFFFVGVAHLAGKPGVLTLLRKQGYTVEPVQ